MPMRRLTITFSWPWSPDETRELLSFVFQVFLLSYLGFYLLESLVPGLVRYSFDPNILLWPVVVSGILSSVWPALTADQAARSTMTWRDSLFIIVLSVASIGVVWLKVKMLGTLALPVAILSGLIVAGLSFLVYYDRDETDPAHHEPFKK